MSTKMSKTVILLLLVTAVLISNVKSKENECPTVCEIDNCATPDNCLAGIIKVLYQESLIRTTNVLTGRIFRTIVAAALFADNRKVSVVTMQR